MKIVIPISEKEIVNDSFLKGIEKQTVECKVVFVKNPVTFKGDNSYLRNSTQYKERSVIIAGSRNLCLPELCKDDVSVMQDSSLIHENHNNIRDMYRLLMSDEKIVAVALAQGVREWFPLEYKHIKHGCVMARRSLWQKVVFEVPNNERCTCLSFNRQARKFGIYRFLDLNNQRVSLKKSVIL